VDSGVQFAIATFAGLSTVGLLPHRLALPGCKDEECYLTLGALYLNRRDYSLNSCDELVSDRRRALRNSQNTYGHALHQLLRACRESVLLQNLLRPFLSRRYSFASFCLA
jgi:hypothetical protein